MRTRGVSLQQPPSETSEDEGSEAEEQAGVLGKLFPRLFGTGGGEEESEEGRGLGPDADPEDEEKCDLEGLFEFFDELESEHIKLVETTYIVNKWAWGGIIPFTHHGFCFRTSRGDYFSLDFSRKGIVWDTYGDEPPEMPDGTVYTEVFRISVEPAPIRRYCEETRPFQWMKNDCDTWSQGLLTVMGVSHQFRKTRQVCGSLQPPAAPAGAGGAAPAADAERRAGGRRTRTGDCL